ncbi:MAG: hypothetical protein BGP06_06050 [Rhizobiales bacterium 65-9]|nr:DUF1467 family protein [Hyphomicrobiales bacterium]OJY35422.1 MAG: hypothetical protein BGP06_06050 [Rhizobiales bacterium 65-9]
MPWGTIVAIYFVAWWLVLFVTLPFGVRSQAEHGDIAPGTEPGAPVRPRLLAKAAWTSVIAMPVTALIIWSISAFFE